MPLREHARAVFDHQGSIKGAEAQAEGRAGARDHRRRAQRLRAHGRRDGSHLRGRPTIAALERFRAIDAVKRDFDLLDEEDKARVDEADTTRRAEIEAGASNLIAG
jgi:hypothetical protein